MDLGSGNSVVHDLVWAPDGGLLVTMSTWDAQPPDPPYVRSLSRFEVDGQRRWVVKEQGHFGNVGATPVAGWWSRGPSLTPGKAAPQGWTGTAAKVS